MTDTSAPKADPQAAVRKRQRSRMFAILGGVVAVAAIGYGGYQVVVGSHYVTTDNAYAGASVAQITPQVGGSILTVPIHETQIVKAGDVLMTIDPEDARLALAQATAEYRRAQSRVRGYFAGDSSALAQIDARSADVARAQAELEQARSDLSRRQGLAASGAVSGQELADAQNAVRTKQAALAQAEANRKAAQAGFEQQQTLSGGGGIDANPEVAAAKAAYDIAKVNLERTVIRAPINGVIANNHAQVGQRVQAGTIMMTVAPIQEAFVDANFKEGQLRKVRVGQTATLEADLYGKDVEYHGTVIGIGGGTGAAFAAIPAQNATGNWIKVVQRVPVRIAIDPKELAEHPLRVGLSMSAKIKVG
ncbi:MAG: HlyD family secretion protein [Caulobacterales bacterium]|nr:HlyD family secretion protein [Caulobacterales bacterium]